MPTDLQVRTQYLALAEFCQRVISSLWDFIDGTAELQTEVLNDAQNALRSIKSGDPYGFGQRSVAALGSYEQVCTLEDVWRTPAQEEVLQLIAHLLNSAGQAPADAPATAKKLIKAFLKRQTKALWNFEQPKPSAPPDIGELCQALARA